jgi:hypothetical protein
MKYLSLMMMLAITLTVAACNPRPAAPPAEDEAVEVLDGEATEVVTDSASPVETTVPTEDAP